MKTCSVCERPYEYSCRQRLVDGVWSCEHDGGNIGSYNGEISTSEWGRKQSIERAKHAKDLLQPWRRDGSVNPDFKKVYGDRAYKRDPRTNRPIPKRDEKH